MGYVDKVGERLEEYGPWNARLHLVFENGTEMNMLFSRLRMVWYEIQKVVKLF